MFALGLLTLLFAVMLASSVITYAMAEEDANVFVVSLAILIISIVFGSSWAISHVDHIEDKMEVCIAQSNQQP
jgi:hypothetical protein